MANPRFEKLALERQEAILAAAAEEFAARGYEAASVNRIVERAGTSKGALYYYFENKADLLATVVTRALARLLERLELPKLEELTAENYWEWAREVTRASLGRLSADTWEVKVLWAFYRLREEPAAQVATAGVLEWGWQITRRLLERGQELGQVRTDLPLDLLVEMFRAADEAGDRWLAERWDALDERQRAKLVDARLDLARDMLDNRHVGWER